jgi:23S rRNA (adenine2503-C2)-methyltransferase
LALRGALDAKLPLRSGTVLQALRSGDGTVKIQIRLFDGHTIEAVLLRDGKGRRTACLSTQAGCALGCVFCRTGSLGCARNLSAAEIIEEFWRVNEAVDADGCVGGPERAAHKIDNIVFMGMGEPFLNMPALRGAVELLSCADGIGMSKRRITVSTSGVIAGIRALADEGPDVRLALSLTTADEGLRQRLMPASRAYRLAALKDALSYYQEKRKARITLEAVLLGGVNTRREGALALRDFARGLDVLVNLIPWNRAEGLCFEGRPLVEPSAQEVARFASALYGLKVQQRREKGRDIGGACGQLGQIKN